MKKYTISFEGGRHNKDRFTMIREFAESIGIDIKSMRVDPIFINNTDIKFLAKSQGTANNLRDFIWDEINGGAFCELKAA